MNGAVKSLFALLILVPAPALGAVSLCVEQGSTGFDWVNGRWVKQNYSLDQHLVRKVAPTEDIGKWCFERIQERGLNTQPMGDGWSNGCYTINLVGEEPNYVDLCQEFWAGDRLRYVACTTSIVPSYKFEPSGEFVIYRTFGAAYTPVDPAKDRDSLVLAVGSCSVIQP